jgi:GNAT superfamily N-acetyltransferase
VCSSDLYCARRRLDGSLVALKTRLSPELGRAGDMAHEARVNVAHAHVVPVPESPTVGARLGNVHLVGIHPDYRRRGVGKLLYAAFEQDCRAEGCTALKAITTMGDEGSVRFHLALGWNVREVADYAGPGRARLLFHKRLASS